MQVKRTATGSEPVTASEVKNYLKVDFTTDDTFIAQLITGVREAIEEFTGLSLVASNVVYFDDVIDEVIKLPYPEHLAVTELRYNGAISTDYKKTGFTQLIIKTNGTAANDDNDSGIKISYTTTGVCPTGIKNEILKAIDEKYRNRGNTFEGAIADLSENSYANLSKYCLM